MDLYEGCKKELNEINNLRSSNKLKEARDKLNKLKVKFLDFESFMIPESIYNNKTTKIKREILIVREALEIGCMIAVKMSDLKEFEKQLKQVSTYYQNAHYFGIKDSERKPIILGMNLLHLLAGDKRGEFHSTLSEIPVEYHNNVYIKYPIELETLIMEGSYNKLSVLSKMAPADEYLVFVNKLVVPIREEVGLCIEKSYNELEYKKAQTLLLLSGKDEEMKNFYTKRKWKLRNDGKFDFSSFKRKEKEKWRTTAKGVIKMSLTYAKDVDEIL